MPHERIPHAQDQDVGGRRGPLDGNEKALIRPHLDRFRKEGPDFKDFTDLYSPQDIGADVVAVENKREKKKDYSAEQEEREFYATILEMVLTEFGNAWLPGTLTRTSEYDDFERGTDMVMEVTDDAGTIHRIGLDVVSGKKSTDDKIIRITDQLFRGDFQALKYFESDVDETRGTTDMPKAIIGTDRDDDIAQLARLFLSHIAAKEAKNTTRMNAIRESIAEHELGKQLRFELIFQMEHYPVYLERALEKRPELRNEIRARIEELDRLGGIFREHDKQKGPGKVELSRAGNGVLNVLALRLSPSVS